MNTQKTGEFIKALRKENNMTQLQLAEKLSCTDKAISRWETGKGLPDADMLLALSDTFSVSINEILLGERFSFAVSDNEAPEEVTESQKIEEIISVTDETIVNIIKDKEEKITSTNQSAVMVVILCCIQAWLMFASPAIARKFDLDIDLMINGSLVNFLLASLIRDKVKWIFPLFATVCVLAFLIIDSGDAYIYLELAPIFGVVSAGMMGIVSALRFIINKFLKRKES